jgi:hypothetical protein
VYEPIVGRFLGVDQIVQLGSSQSPNAFAYVWNNPLTLTDPSGFCINVNDCRHAQHFDFGGSGWLQRWLSSLMWDDPPAPNEENYPRDSGEILPSAAGGSDRSPSYFGGPAMYGVGDVTDHFRGRRTPETREQVVAAAAHWLRSQGLIDFMPQYIDRWALGHEHEVKLTCEDPSCTKFREIDKKRLSSIAGTTSSSGEVFIYRMAVEDLDFRQELFIRGPPKDLRLINLKDEFSIIERAIFIIAHEGYHYSNLGLPVERGYVEPWANEAGMNAVGLYRLWWRR